MMKKIQQLSTSLKALLAIGGISVLAGGGVIITNAMEADSRIDADKAKEIALQDAGVKATAAQFEKAALEKDDGQSVYEVKFHTDEHAYEYTITAKDGHILDRDVDTWKQGPAADTSPISLQDAKNRMLKNAGLKERDGTFLKASLNKEDAQEIYELKFKTAQKTYEYKLLAKDGTILEKDMETNAASGSEPENNKGNSTASQQLISKADARSRALQDAGVSAKAATFTKTKLDYENGRQVYEIEFVTATMEYDYELDAESGAVRERKSERLEIQNQEQSKPSASYIGVDRAKSTALSHAGLQAGSVTFTKAKLENDDGMSVYEIEFRKGSTEYEYSIDAYKGTILEWDKETDHD